MATPYLESSAPPPVHHTLRVDDHFRSMPAEHADSFQWYAIWSRSRHEKVVYQQLVEKHVEAFLPTIWRWSRSKDRRRRVEWPLFPGYCFARFDATCSLPILKCTGVVSIVSIAGEPAPIIDDEIHSLRILVGSQLQYDPCPLLDEGMEVRIAHGPLAGVTGRLIRKNFTKATVVLSVNLLGQAVKVEVDAADITRE